MLDGHLVEEDSEDTIEVSKLVLVEKERSNPFFISPSEASVSTVIIVPGGAHQHILCPV